MKSQNPSGFALCLVVGFSLIVARVTNGQHVCVSAKAITDYQTTIKSEQEDKDRIDQLIAKRVRNHRNLKHLRRRKITS